jgi:hypothetical protein
MDYKLGLKVKFIDPENPANVINSQFATVRGHGEMRNYLADCAKAEVAEAVALRRYNVAQEALDTAKTAEELNTAADALVIANDERIATGQALLDAVHTFVVKGFELAGADTVNAENLAQLVTLEQLTELRVKCQFGAGVLDFTKQGGN